MQREIKFRAWDKKEKCWKIRANTDMNYDTLNFGFWGKEELELMQYTGLKDKNGKEVWEGDIVEYKTQKGIIVFQNGSFSVEIDTNKPLSSSFFIFKDCEVVGNIYEHPELIK